MVKIRLRRMGNKHRPFYRIVVARSTAARDGSFIEQLGTYNPLTQPKQLQLDGQRALHWLMEGAQPTETVAILMKKQGVLDEFFQQRPKAKGSYKFLDKRTAAMSRPSAVTTVPAAAPAEDKLEEKAEAQAEAAVEAPAEEAPAAEPAQAEAPAEEAPAAEPKASAEEAATTVEEQA
jgi:small subunit ribosomal protein S16